MRRIIELSGEERDELIACLGAAYQVGSHYAAKAPEGDCYRAEAFEDAFKADDATERLAYYDVTEGEVLRYASIIKGPSREELDIYDEHSDQIYLQSRRVVEHVRGRVREARKTRKAESTKKPMRVS